MLFININLITFILFHINNKFMLKKKKTDLLLFSFNYLNVIPP
jgi:hypothetical protein